RDYMRHCIDRNDVLSAAQRQRLRGWLGPELFNVVAPGGVASTASWLDSPATLDALIARNSSPAGQARDITAASRLSWVDGIIATVNEDVRDVQEGTVVRLADEAAAAPAIECIHEAMAQLRLAWPEAAIETTLLVSDYIYVTGAHYRSGAMHRYFGCMLVGTGYVNMVERAYETLLHETGHTVLYLKSSFSQYLNNPDERAVHPLRREPRPMLGTLHAAISLYRVVRGFTKLLEAGFGSVEAEQVLAQNSADLAAALRVLTEHADWTPSGARFFDSMRQELNR
ncbi:MAG TPA: HEXXH motif-containing putative peptide modification protein, partial [Jatrophihabitans sp.]|nr:HEXXH motif-containing putative peptide modification protein [Jatrophihabitans sp.]